MRDSDDRPDNRFVLPLVLIGLGVLSLLVPGRSSAVLFVPAAVVGVGLLIPAAIPMSASRTRIVLAVLGSLLVAAALVACYIFANQHTEVGGLVAVACLVFGGIPGLILIVLGLLWRPAREDDAE